MTELAKDAGYAQPAGIADQVMLLFEDAISATALGSVNNAVSTARVTTQRLLSYTEIEGPKVKVRGPGRPASR